MKKTTHYQLNKPESGDPLRVADFNENADIIDGALARLETEKLIFGSFVGDGQEERFVDMGCTPALVIFMSENPENILFCIVSAEFAYYSYSGSSSRSNVTQTRVTQGGVTIRSGTNNSNGVTTRYIAVL